MRRLIWIISALAAAGCGSGGSGGSGGAGGSAQGTCGDQTCTAGQLCVEPCEPMPCGGDAGVACSPPFCWTPPTSCGTSPKCACVQAADPCNTHGGASLGVCTTIASDELTCGACD